MAPTLLNYREYFNEAPDDDEILRMVEYYPTFSPDYRFGFLIGYFEGLTFNELLKRKLKSQDIDINELLLLDKSNRDLIKKKELLEQEKKKISKTKDQSLFKKSINLSKQINELEIKNNEFKTKIDALIFLTKL